MSIDTFLAGKLKDAISKRSEEKTEVLKGMSEYVSKMLASVDEHETGVIVQTMIGGDDDGRTSDFMIEWGFLKQRFSELSELIENQPNGARSKPKKTASAGGAGAPDDAAKSDAKTSSLAAEREKSWPKFSKKPTGDGDESEPAKPAKDR